MSDKCRLIESGDPVSDWEYFEKQGRLRLNDLSVKVGGERLYIGDMSDSTLIRWDLEHRFPDHDIVVEYQEDLEKDIDWIHYEVWKCK